MLNVALGKEDEEFLRWVNEVLPRRYEAFLKDPSLGIPVEEVRARLNSKMERDAARREQP